MLILGRDEEGSNQTQFREPKEFEQMRFTVLKSCHVEIGGEFQYSHKKNIFELFWIENIETGVTVWCLNHEDIEEKNDINFKSNLMIGEYVFYFLKDNPVLYLKSNDNMIFNEISSNSNITATVYAYDST